MTKELYSGEIVGAADPTTMSSGLDAVDDILSVGTMPVIFITAYPERLLTGDRPEPTYLVTKPFQEATVRAAISQALFFGSSRPLV